MLRESALPFPRRLERRHRILARRGIGTVNLHLANPWPMFRRGPARVAANLRRATAKKLCPLVSMSPPRSCGIAVLAFGIRRRLRTYYPHSGAASNFAFDFDPMGCRLSICLICAGVLPRTSYPRRSSSATAALLSSSNVFLRGISVIGMN